MFREYYNKLVDTYFRTGNLFLFVFARVWLVSLVRFLVLSLIFFLVFFLVINTHKLKLTAVFLELSEMQIKFL